MLVNDGMARWDGYTVGPSHCAPPPQQLLGKSNQVRDFVQRGKPFAELELELYAADHNTVTVKRRIESGPPLAPPHAPAPSHAISCAGGLGGCLPRDLLLMARQIVYSYFPEFMGFELFCWGEVALLPPSIDKHKKVFF